MLENLFKSRDEAQKLQPAIEETIIKPAREAHRKKNIEVQLSVPQEIEATQRQINELAPKQAEAKNRVKELEQTLAAVQADLSAAKAKEDSLHWQLFELRGRIDSLKEKQRAYGSAVILDFVQGTALQQLGLE